MSEMDWKGCDDGTPCSDPKYGPRDAPESPGPRGNDWQGQDDDTPSSMPMPPHKEPS